MLLAACHAPARAPSRAREPYAVVLGIAQDGGAPQAGCNGPCCAPRWHDPTRREHVACLAIVDPRSGERWLIDATPDFGEQLHRLDEIAPTDRAGRIDGILLTHAHIGHYLGLAQLGREVMGAQSTPVYAMPRMAEFLEHNGPWSQLVSLKNVDLRRIKADQPVRLNERIEVEAFVVPHRDEFSETVGYLVRGPGATLAWLPDIDKWERWDRSLEELLQRVDVAFVDGTFYDASELPGRDMSEIPHPFIAETMARLADRTPETKRKVRFIHLNHSNPALERSSSAARAVRQAGFEVSAEGDVVPLARVVTEL